jgi:type IV pilus modification protein PilV
MNYRHRCDKQQGIGLIEVLIATVVVAVGLLAVASLQGKFMSSSGSSKTAAQAIKLAEAKTEEFRNNSILTGFSALASGTDTVSGGNATFTRTWTVTALTNADGTTDPTRKKIAVAVTWPPATASETVNIASQIAWLNPGNSSYNSTSAAGAGVTARAPDPSQNSSTPGQPASYTAGTGTALNDGSGLKTSTDSQGNMILLNAGGTVLQTYFGGIINSISGSVYTANDFTNLVVAVSETAGRCVYTNAMTSFGTGASAGQKRDYICYTGGNCLHSAGLYGCPASPTAAQLVAQNYVGPGGWYGNVGFLGLGTSGGTQEKVCFHPDVSGFSAREYSTVRTSSGVVSSEGINRSFSCHDFLVVNQNGTKSDCATVITAFGMSPEPQKITRALTGDSTTAPNTVLAQDTSYCAVTTHAVTVTATVTGGYTLTSGTLSVTPASGSGSCTAGSSPYTAYTCTVPDNQDGNLVFAGSTSTGTCTGSGSYVSSASAQTAALTITCIATRNIAVTTAQVGTGTVSGITISGTGATCTGLSCTVADTWTGTLTATGTCNGTPTTVSGTATITTVATTAAGITLGTCTAPAGPTYAITTTPAHGSGLVTSSTCNGSSCTGLVAGTYTVVVWLSGGNTCSGNYAISGNKSITVTKATGQGQVCTMSP